MPSSKRDLLVETALRLFQANGFHATGIDTILREAGVAKMTLYNHFRSKDELIVAALELQDRRFTAWFEERLDDLARTPRDKLLAIFDVLEEWFTSDGFSGCIFINASAEFGGRDHPVHAAAAQQKRAIFDRILTLADAADAADSRNLAQNLLILRDGAVAVAQVLDAPIAARQAKRVARLLIDESVDG